MQIRLKFLGARSKKLTVEGLFIENTHRFVAFIGWNQLIEVFSPYCEIISNYQSNSRV